VREVSVRLSKWQRICKALGQETRLKLFLILMQGELCVCQLDAVFSVSQSAISQHLRVLREAGLVKTKRRAQWVFYSSTVHKLSELVADLDEQVRSGTCSDIHELYETASAVDIQGCTSPEQ
jgi:ArsR family transcriptional regulator